MEDLERMIEIQDELTKVYGTGVLIGWILVISLGGMAIWAFILAYQSYRFKKDMEAELKKHLLKRKEIEKRLNIKA